jgi:serine/threonine-protein kinase
MLLRIVADACGGLHAAHELRDEQGALLNVVHRDVSPQNILVSQRGIAKLIDFGIAKARDRVIGDTNAGLLKGKIHYMAPEQALGGAVDRRADVFAAGAILYHYLAGAPPFDGPNQLAVLNRLTMGQPPAPLPPSVPPAVASIVMRALAYSRDDRFATAADLQAAIESAMIESKLTCTQAQVASFAAEHGATRTASRKEAIDLALSAAAERARVRDVLRPNPDKSATGVLASDTDFQSTGVVSVGSRPSLTPPAVPPAVPSGSIDVGVEPTSNKGKIAFVIGALVVFALLIGGGTAVVLANRSASSVVVVAPKATATVTATSTPTATTAPTATIEIPSIDPDSLPTAVADVTNNAAPARPQASAHAVPTAAPTDSAAAGSRRSKYGF